MPREVRLDAPGTLHHVIIRGIERRHIELDINSFLEMGLISGNFFKQLCESF